MKNKTILVVSIIIIVITVIGVIVLMNRHNDKGSDTPIYTTQEGAVVNRDAIIVTTNEPEDFVDKYIIQDYNNITWNIGIDVINPNITEIYEFLKSSSDINNIDDVFAVEVYNSEDADYRYYLSVKEAGDIKSIYVP